MGDTERILSLTQSVVETVGTGSSGYPMIRFPACLTELAETMAERDGGGVTARRKKQRLSSLNEKPGADYFLQRALQERDSPRIFLSVNSRVSRVRMGTVAQNKCHGTS